MSYGNSTRVGALVAFLIVALVAGCASLPNDGKEAKVMRFDGLRGVRYCEVFLIGGDAAAHDLDAFFYNTTALNDAADPRDTCPAALWDKLDTRAVKTRYSVLGVFKNGPRDWAADWIELPVGAQRNFEGLEARWMGEVELPKNVNLHKKGWTAYQPTLVARRSKMGFVKGKPIFILESPDGIPWVMQAYSNIVNPYLTYTDLASLDRRLNPPSGWKFRVEVLDRDLEIDAVNGHARVVQDELENTYDACFETACSYKP